MECPARDGCLVDGRLLEWRTAYTGHQPHMPELGLITIGASSDVSMCNTGPPSQAPRNIPKVLSLATSLPLRVRCRKDLHSLLSPPLGLNAGGSLGCIGGTNRYTAVPIVHPLCLSLMSWEWAWHTLPIFVMTPYHLASVPLSACLASPHSL